MWRVQAGSPLLLVGNVKGREWMEEGTFSNEGPALDLGKSWPVQIPEGAAGRTFSLGKHALVKGQGQGWIAFALQRDKVCYSWM